MNISWASISGASLENASKYLEDLKGTSISRPWQVALASVSGVVLAGTAGVLYLRWREQISEKANQFVQLEKMGENLWTGRYHFQKSLPPVALSSNTAVIRVKAGAVIYNPVKLTPQLKKQIDALGVDAKFVVVANKEHLMFFTDYVEAYSNVRVFCPSGALEVVKKRLKYNGVAEPSGGIVELKDEELPQGAWTEDEISHQHFLEKEWLDEVVLFHKPSGVLLTCDTCFNVKPGTILLQSEGTVPLMEKLAHKFGVDDISPSSNYKMLIKDKKKAREELEKICAWDFKGIFMAHGMVVPPTEKEDVKGKWKAAWEKLLA